MKCDELKALMCAHEPNVRPMYDKSEVDAAIAELKARIADLEKLNHDLCERVTENDDIRLHWEEIEQTRAENAQLKAKLEDVQASMYCDVVDANMENRRLKEESRWRKFPEEKPEGEGDYLVMARYPDDDEPHIEICFYDVGGEDFGHYERRYAGSGNSFGGYDGEEWVTHNVSFWMPLPKSPKEADK